MDANGRRERALRTRLAGFLLVGGLLLQAFAPHFHGVASPLPDDLLVETPAADTPGSDAVAPPECLACRTTEQLRLGIVVSTASNLPTSPDVAMRADEDIRAAAFELLLDLAPPRAPPA